MSWAGGKKGRGRGGGGGGGGGGGRGVRGVDFGLGIGYNPESNGGSGSSQAVPSRSVAVNSLRTGMMTQFKSSFVAASSNSQNQGSSNTSSAPARPALRGFVSGGSIGGDMYRAQTTNSSTYAPASGMSTSSSQNASANANQKNSDRLVIICKNMTMVLIFQGEKKPVANFFIYCSCCSSRDRSRERRRPSGWDR